MRHLLLMIAVCAFACACGCRGVIAARDYVHRSYIPGISAKTDRYITEVMTSNCTCDVKALKVAETLCTREPRGEAWVVWHSCIGETGHFTHLTVAWKAPGEREYMIDSTDYKWNLKTMWFGEEFYRQKWAPGMEPDYEAINRAYEEFWK